MSFNSVNTFYISAENEVLNSPLHLKACISKKLANRTTEWHNNVKIRQTNNKSLQKFRILPSDMLGLGIYRLVKN